LLLNATGAGTETLKNLILPAVGKFTIVDDALISERDCGNNFFVT
jgi:amyloid beta precursor protein binding protein 1